MGSISEQDIAVEVTVLIVGGGPTGLLAAFLLSKLGGTSSPDQTESPNTLLTILKSSPLSLKNIHSG